jgi:hypothetical protein
MLNGGHDDPASIRIRAGALTARIEAGALRTIQAGGIEAVRQVYAAVRDHNWSTIPGELTDIDLEQSDDGVRYAYTSTHRSGDVHFVWHGEIIGSSRDNTLTFIFDGEAKSDFRANRVGFCVLHPGDIAGQPCTILHTDGASEEAGFPADIMPHQPFFDVRAITHETANGARVTVTMEGDTFETEDQRNWTDASFKTYCTPLALPYPRMIAAGTRIRQVVTISAVMPPDAPSVTSDDDDDAQVVMTVTGATVPVPRIGLCVNADGAPITLSEAATLRTLRPAHLRLDLHPAAPDAHARYAQAASQARALDSGLLVALHLTDDADAELGRVADWTHEQDPPLDAWLIFKASSPGTPAALVNKARNVLSRFQVPVGSGTNGYFTELNRHRPDASGLDFVAYSVNPQVHAFDNASLVETLQTQGDTVRSAAAFTGKPVVVSPVTLHIRWNPNATSDDPPTPPGQLPRQVDTRQLSQFGAAWTLGSIKHLAEAGASAITYYELTGWLGVMERETGSPLPALFPSEPGQPYPLFDVLRSVNEFAGGTIRVMRSSAPLRAVGLVLERGGSMRIMLANFINDYVDVRIPGFLETTLEPYAVVIADGQSNG